LIAFSIRVAIEIPIPSLGLNVGHGDDNSQASSAEVKDDGATPYSPIYLHNIMLI
jgi:hypothetical protein